ncbi:carboxypeptidase-like regulatory domain-containing protein [Nocardioides sp. BP30]|uniref:carboxypeptidase-like regulatory domain-containing protein n=1 Tax=Nocardioides sp. BP30 TaxID=3036374 RepID=UPI0024693CB1|nr:carboxypeptidase-like regulatory domain-containing protein [Nocardioides sp. BP30]WGL53579.1 carboxypeptidase-like regulatory domain-containing protein [Nocardioides sp. BP30]
MKMIRWAAPAALTVALVGAPLTLLPTAAQATGGTDSLSVTVDDFTTGAPLGGVNVELYSTATGATVGNALTTDSSGNVTFGNLADGSYTAKAVATSTHHDQFSVVENLDANNASADVTISPVSVGASRGSLTGTVTQATTTYLYDYVAVYPATTTQTQIANKSVNPVSTSWEATGSDTPTTLSTTWRSSIPVGQYKVVAYDVTSGGGSCCPSSYATAVWAGAPTSANDADHAAIFTVKSAAATNIGSTALPAAANVITTPEIGGTVTGVGGIKLASASYQDDVEVMLYRQDTSNSTWSQVAATWTDDKGTYSFSGQPAGTYTLRVWDPSGEYGDEWLGGTAVDSSAVPPAGVPTFTIDGTTPVTKNITAKQTTLDTSSGLHGTITDDAGKAHPGRIDVYDVYGFEVWESQTRRDGTWTLPTTSLAPGQYKVEAADSDDVSSYYGGKTFKTASTFTVPVKGSVSAGGSKLLRYATISGKITLPAVSGTDEGQVYLQLLDGDGYEVDNTGANDDGSYSFVEQPGTYYLVAYGRRDASWDDTDANLSEVDFVPQFWKGRYTLASATPIKLGSGAKATVSYTLGRTLLATAAPTISGSATQGGTLTATTGTWNVTQDLAYSYTWKRGATVLSHAASYKPVAADQGQTLTVSVQARDTNGDYLSGSTTKSVKVAAAPVKKHHHKKHKKHKK